MVKLYDGGVYLVDGKTLVEDAAALPGLFAHNKSPLLRVNIPQPV